MHWRSHWRLRRLKWTSTLFYSFLSISRWKPDECLLFWSSAQATLETWLVYCENLPQVRIFNSALIQGVVRVQYLFLSITQIWLLAMIPQLGLSGLCGLNGTFPSLNAVEFVNGVPNMCAALLHHDLARPIRGHWRVTPGLALISVPSCDPGLGQNYLTPTNKRSVYGWWFQIFPHLPGEVPRFHIILLLGSSLLPSCFPPSFPPFFCPSVLPPSSFSSSCFVWQARNLLAAHQIMASSQNSWRCRRWRARRLSGAYRTRTLLLALWLSWARRTRTLCQHARSSDR